MRIAFFVFSLLLFSSPKIWAVGVVSHWVNPSRASARFEVPPHERTRPVIVGDIIYFANLSGDVFAVHRTEGYLLWQKRLPSGVEGALSYGRAKLFVGDLSGNLFALNARDGSVAWSFKIQGEWLSPPAVLRDRIFAITSADELYALSEAQGKELWHYSHRGDEKMTVRGVAGPAVFGNEVFQGFSDGNIVGLSAAQGKVLWTKKLKSKERFYDVDGTAYVDEKSVIAATFDGKLYSLDRLSGNSQWIFPVGSYGGFLVEDDTLYFSGLDGNFYALNRSTGEMKWKTPFETGVGLTPARSGNFLVLTTSSDPVYLLDPRDGKAVWKGSLGAGSMAGPTAQGDGWFYCFSNYGNLFSFEIVPTLVSKRGPETVQTPSAIQRKRVEHRETQIAS